MARVAAPPPTSPASGDATAADPRIPSCAGFDLDGTLINHYSDTRAEVDVGPCTIELTQGRDDWVVSGVDVH